MAYKMCSMPSGRSKIAMKTRRGVRENYGPIKIINKKSINTPDEAQKVEPHPTFHKSKKEERRKEATVTNDDNTTTRNPDEIVKYISDSWNMVTSCTSAKMTPTNSHGQKSTISYRPGVSSPSSTAKNSPRNGKRCTAVYCAEPPSPALENFKAFDLDSWWAVRIFDDITKDI